MGRFVNCEDILCVVSKSSQKDEQIRWFILLGFQFPGGKSIFNLKFHFTNFNLGKSSQVI